MEALRVLILLMPFFSCAHCNIELNQPDSVTVKPGESLTISCKVSGYSLTDRSHCTHFIRQPSGKALERIAEVCGSGNTYYKDSLKNKFTISRDTSSSTVSLQGKSLQTEDTAVYYCARERDTGNYFDYWGNGTKVTVDSPKRPNFLYALRPCNPSGSAGLISLGCVAGGFSPVDSVSFSWKGSSGNQLSDINQYSVVNDKGVSMVVSEIRVKAADWGGQTHYECVARHQSLGRELSRRIRKPGSMSPPTVSINIPTPEDLQKSEFNLVCLVTGFYPEEIDIMWQQNGTQNKYEEGITGEPFQTGDEYSVTSLFKVSKVDWDNGKTYTCNARHASQEGKQIPALNPVSKLTGNSLECPVCE